jgi:DNA-nicking Smr family endonuclease
MTSITGNRSRHIAGTDRALWEAVKKSIKPLHRRRAATPPKEKIDLEVVLQTNKLSNSAHPAQATRPAALKKGPPALALLDRRMKKRVARGSVQIDARIDLHGQTQQEAYRTLLNFLRRAQNDRAKLLLVITGKGGSRDNGRGVLRRQVPIWFAQPEFREYVVGFDTAHISHGGEGALYVHIRRGKG